MGMMTFRNEIAGADVQKKAGEHCQKDAQSAFGQGEEQSGCHTQPGCNCIGCQPAQCITPAAVVFQHHIHGVDAVGEIMRQDTNGDNNACRM